MTPIPHSVFVKPCQVLELRLQFRQQLQPVAGCAARAKRVTSVRVQSPLAGAEEKIEGRGCLPRRSKHSAETAVAKFIGGCGLHERRCGRCDAACLTTIMCTAAIEIDGILRFI